MLGPAINEFLHNVSNNFVKLTMYRQGTWEYGRLLTRGHSPSLQNSRFKSLKFITWSVSSAIYCFLCWACLLATLKFVYKDGDTHIYCADTDSSVSCFHFIIHLNYPTRKKKSKSSLWGEQGADYQHPMMQSIRSVSWVLKSIRKQ